MKEDIQIFDHNDSEVQEDQIDTPPFEQRTNNKSRQK